jgi:hypothetical protein
MGSDGKARLGPSASDLVIISRALTDLGEFLQRRQESAGRGRVILDRRVAERRHANDGVDPDRRRSDRRRPPADPTQALMLVLGFMVVPTAVPPPRSASRRDGQPRTRSRSRQAALRRTGR